MTESVTLSSLLGLAGGTGSGDLSTGDELMALTEFLVSVASPSFEEAALVAWIETQLASLPHLQVDRVGDNVVARTTRGLSARVVLAGHTDTVPANNNATARRDGDQLWGVGSADMKGGLAIMLASAALHSECPVDVTYVFYAREEVAAVHSGLGELVTLRPELLEGDLAILGEPTDGAIEAGCQGSIRLRITLAGERAHTARAWMGRNAIHRLGPLLSAVAAWEPRQPVIQGCQFHEALQVVGVDGGVSGNVVPDRVTVQLAHRFAPDRSAEEAERWVRDFLAEFVESGDVVEVDDVAPAAHPSLDQPLLARLVADHGLDVRSKLGWTDVARFVSLGVPAVNLGPGDATIAHTEHEMLRMDSLVRVWSVIDAVVRRGLGPLDGLAAGEEKA